MLVTTRGDDAYVEGTTAETVSISSTAGGNYEALTTTSTATVNVTDDADATVVTLTASAASVTEGGSVVYTASVNNYGDRQRPGGDAVQLRHDHDPVGSSAPTACKPVTVTRATTLRHRGTTAETVSISSTAISNYEALATTSTATVNVTDAPTPRRW